MRTLDLMPACADPLLSWASLSAAAASVVAAAGNASTAAAVSSGGDAGGGGCSEVLSLREGSLDALGAMLILGGQGL